MSQAPLLPLFSIYRFPMQAGYVQPKVLDMFTWKKGESVLVVVIRVLVPRFWALRSSSLICAAWDWGGATLCTSLSLPKQDVISPRKGLYQFFRLRHIVKYILADLQATIQEKDCIFAGWNPRFRSRRMIRGQSSSFSHPHWSVVEWKIARPCYTEREPRMRWEEGERWAGRIARTHHSYVQLHRIRKYCSHKKGKCLSWWYLILVSFLGIYLLYMNLAMRHFWHSTCDLFSILILH